jgi:hypothetical protein
VLRPGRAEPDWRPAAVKATADVLVVVSTTLRN